MKLVAYYFFALAALYRMIFDGFLANCPKKFSRNLVSC